MDLAERFSRSLERLVRPELGLFGRRLPAYGFFVRVGVFASVGLALVLAAPLGLSILLTAGLVGLGLVTTIVVALATKVLTGEEHYVWFHYQIAVLLICAVALRLLERPVLPYLDVITLTLYMALAWGRWGCLLAGCCHGRPHRWGVRYTADHTATGFDPAFVGVRLLPTQAIESLLLFSLVAVGSALAIGGRTPGEALAFCFIGYGAGRFLLEFARGDARPCFRGFPEAQWTALVLMGSVVAAALADLLPFHWWQAIVTALLGLTMVAVTLKRPLSRTPKHGLLHPRHLAQVAEIVGRVSPPAPLDRSRVRVATTSLGICISTGRIDNATGSIHHFTLSRRDPPLTEEAAALVANLIRRLRQGAAPSELRRGRQGVYHLLIHAKILKADSVEG